MSIFVPNCRTEGQIKIRRAWPVSPAGMVPCRSGDYRLKSSAALYYTFTNIRTGWEKDRHSERQHAEALMIPGFEKVVEERIKQAQRKGSFNNLPGSGMPLRLENDSHIPEELRIAHKILKNADMLPPEIELRNEIRSTEDLLSGMPDTAEKYRLTQKLNFLIMRLNTMRAGSAELEIPQQYAVRMIERMENGRDRREGR